MIYILVVRSHRLPLLQEAIAEYNQTNPPTPWGIFKILRFDIAGIPISRCVFIADAPPPENGDVAIEAVFPEGQYCSECLKKGNFKILPAHNKSGFCLRHRDKDPLRNERKKKSN